MLAMRWLIHWVLSALALMLVAHLVPGFHVRNFWIALIAAVAVGFINATLGALLKFFTFPITVLTFGIFLLFINALMLEVAAALIKGFYINSYWHALEGAAILAVLHMVIEWMLKAPQKREA
jgi:putative membrane protein